MIWSRNLHLFSIIIFIAPIVFTGEFILSSTDFYAIYVIFQFSLWIWTLYTSIGLSVYHSANTTHYFTLGLPRFC